MLFTVVIPVYEQWHLIPRLLERLEEQTVPFQSFEVLLVDNGSARFTPPVEFNNNIRVLCCATPGSYAARNHGISRAQGEWLVFTDADCLPEPNWLLALGQASKIHGRQALLAGAVRMVSANTSPNAYEMYDIVKGIPQKWYVERGTATTANLAVHHGLCATLNGFNQARFSGGDAELCRRAVAIGGHLVYVREAQVHHLARTTWTQVRTKARRIRGGHLTTGPLPCRVRWTLRTLIPPLPESWRLLKRSAHPMRFRFWAVLVQWRVWLTDVSELLYLIRGGTPERR